jgi:hypothetical protein
MTNAAIAIHEADNGCARRHCRKASRACATVATIRFAYHGCPSGEREARRIIGRAVVDNDNVVDPCGQHLSNDTGNGHRFVETGDDNDHQ